MARVTVEDCLENVDNRFQLVLVATKRARQIALGSEPQVPIENDKPTVLALREIAAGLVGPSILDEDDIVFTTEPEPEEDQEERGIEDEGLEAGSEGEPSATEEAAQNDAGKADDEPSDPDETSASADETA